MTADVAAYDSIPDRALLTEFRDALNDRMAALERQIDTLRKDPADSAAFTELFRALHTVKGDAAICRFEIGVRIAHPIEDLLARMRNGTLAFTPLLAEAVLLALDRLELAVEARLAGRTVASLRIQPLIEGLERMSRGDGATIDAGAVALIEAVTGFRPAAAGTGLAPLAAPRPTATQADKSADLGFFHDLARQLETRSPLFVGRSERLLRLALDTNSRAGTPVDPRQLEAAVYLHDIGMMLLPESIWLKVGTLTEAERLMVRRHPSFAAGLVERMEGWREAATMIAQHHEMADGHGYPQGLKDSAIVPGAKILAIVDAFEAVMLKHRHRGAGRSLLRAVAEINADDRQFSTEWIRHFNQVIRGAIEA